MTNLKIKLTTDNKWQFVDGNGRTTDFRAATDSSPFSMADLDANEDNLDIAVEGCSASPTVTVELALTGTSIPIRWVPTSPDSIIFKLTATCGSTSESGYVKVKGSSGGG